MITCKTCGQKFTPHNRWSDTCPTCLAADEQAKIEKARQAIAERRRRSRRTRPSNAEQDANRAAIFRMSYGKYMAMKEEM